MSQAKYSRELGGRGERERETEETEGEGEKGKERYPHYSLYFYKIL